MQRYEDRYDIPEEVKCKQIKKETIKLRYIQDILYDLQDRGKVAQQKPFGKVDDNNLDSDYSDAYSLFALANEVGAMIAYAMLDAMNPDSMKHLAKGIDKDQFVQDKINNVISLQYLLWEICKIKIVKRGQTVWNLIPISKSLPPEVQSEHLTSQQRVGDLILTILHGHGMRWITTVLKKLCGPLLVFIQVFLRYLKKQE